MNERLTNSPALNIDGDLGDEEGLAREMKTKWPFGLRSFCFNLNLTAGI